ncbi:hypothetical protein GQ53DRAFT_699532, partial [Thozetella sp. PMI_491]
MYLLDTETLELKEYVGDSIPSYAILSHRWEDEEISMHQLRSGLGQNQRGYLKIQEFCARLRITGFNALHPPFQYAWVDTCCIDKTSSAELSENLNSMFNCYRRAGICYAYLYDVDDVSHDQGSQFCRSEWFARGWTLQELLAPRDLLFFSKSWDLIGSKWGLRKILSSITNIPERYLCGEPLSGASIAQRMSWAANRVTTRAEDIAYSLLGIFDVNIPPIYGEGGKQAFFRLQEAIMKQSEDQSIFAW